jgi:hypothetical protein
MSAFTAKATRGDRPGQAGRGPGARGERNAAAGCSWNMSLLLSPRGQTRRLQRRALSRLYSHCSRPIAPSLGTPFSRIITIPISIYRGGDGDDRFCGGSHVRRMGDGRHLDPPERRLGKPEAPVEERHTGSFLRFIRFLRGCLRRLCVHTRFSDSSTLPVLPTLPLRLLARYPLPRG